MYWAIIKSIIRCIGCRFKFIITINIIINISCRVDWIFWRIWIGIIWRFFNRIYIYILKKGGNFLLFWRIPSFLSIKKKIFFKKILFFLIPSKILFSIISDSYLFFVIWIECQDSQLVDLGISSSLQLRGNIIYYYV